MGNGTANSRGAHFLSIIRGFFGEVREGDGGQSGGMVDRVGVADLGDLGESEASR